jgi:adenylylsulfate kinase
MMPQLHTTAFTVWFTGLTGSGKHTLAEMLHDELAVRGIWSEIIRGREMRKVISEGLGFSTEDREKNIRRMGEVCYLLTKNGVVAIAVAVSPIRRARERNRDKLGEYIEVYCRCSLEELRKRDKYGLYSRYEAGEIKHVAGIDDPYEEPLKPEVLLDTDKVPTEKNLQRILMTLELLEHLPKAPTTPYSPEEEELIRHHLKDMGYL